MSILDCHTHHPAPQPQGIISLTPTDYAELKAAGGLLPEQAYSVGIHPWTTLDSPSPEVWEALESAAADPQVVAIGEAGVDLLKGGPMFRQLQVLKRQIELSESCAKPLILHDVKAHDILVGLKRDLLPAQPWIIHGFRGKPSVATMFLNAGMYLSFGEKFNPDSLTVVPADRLLAETDESSLSIEEIIAALSAATKRNLSTEIEANTSAVFLS